MAYVTESAPQPSPAFTSTPTVAGIFGTEEEATAAVQKLIAIGFDPSRHISVILAHQREHQQVAVPLTVAIAPAAGVGAALGAVLGAVVPPLGVLTGLMAGPFSLLAVGPVVALLQGVSLGVAGGGALGALIGLGLWKEEPDFAASDIHEGVVWVGVHADGERARHAEAALREAGARHFQHHHLQRPSPRG